MANNISLNAQTVESGAVLATDQAAGGEQFQYVKVAFGADATQTKVASGTGLPVAQVGPVSLTGSIQVAGITSAVTVTGAVAISLSHSVVVSNTVTVTGTVEVGGDVSLTGSMSVVISSGTITSVTNPVTVTGAVAISLSHSVVISSGTVTIGAGTANIGTVSLSGSTSAVVVGAAAHDAAVSGNPVLQGLEARTTMPTAVANGDAVRAMADDNGRQVITPVAPRDLVGMTALSLTVSTTTTFLAAGGAGVFRDIIGFTLTNPSSATQASVILYAANSATGTSLSSLTEVARFELAPNGGAVYTPCVPIPALGANKPWGIKSGVVSIQCSIQYADNN